MSKQLYEANVNLSITDLNSTDLETLSRVLSLAGQAETGNAEAEPELALGLDGGIEMTSEPMGEPLNIELSGGDMAIDDDLQFMESLDRIANLSGMISESPECEDEFEEEFEMVEEDCDEVDESYPADTFPIPMEPECDSGAITDLVIDPSDVYVGHGEPEIDFETSTGWDNDCIDDEDMIQPEVEVTLIEDDDECEEEFNEEDLVFESEMYRILNLSNIFNKDEQLSETRLLPDLDLDEAAGEMESQGLGNNKLYGPFRNPLEAKAEALRSLGGGQEGINFKLITKPDGVFWSEKVAEDARNRPDFENVCTDAIVNSRHAIRDKADKLGDNTMKMPVSEDVKKLTASLNEAFDRFMKGK